MTPAGGTVLTGLIDAHVHVVPGALAQSLTFGVTTVLDMFSQPDLVAIENTLGEPGGAAVAGDPRLAEVLGDAWARRLTSDAPGCR